MSPEAGKPEAQTQTGSDKFVEGLHPTDGVRPFNDAKGDLPDVHETLLERGAPEASAIDPITLDVTVDKVQLPTTEATDVTTEVAPATETLPTETSPVTTETAPAKTEKKSGWKRWVAGLLAGAALTGGGVVASKAMGGNDTEAPRSEPSASASPTPGGGETEINPDTDPVSIDNIKIRPTPEQLELAEQPVTKEAYPTVEQAYPALIDRTNIFVTGAIMDFEATPAAETPESVVAGERVLDAIYGPGYESRSGFDITGMQSLRHGIGLEFYYLYESRGDEGTFRINSEVISTEEATLATVPEAVEAYTIHSTVSTETNIPELDPSQVVINVSPPTERETIVFLTEDGNWHILTASNLD